MPDNSDVFDYVIVGAGTAGSILTNRLSTDGARVCLLEAGPEDHHPFIHIPAGPGSSSTICKVKGYPPKSISSLNP